MKSIGGYLELELSENEEYHKQAIRLNTGRNALEYILRAYSYRKIYLPYYTCDALLQPIQRLGIKYEFYNINEDFEPLFDFNKIKSETAFLYTNYFGLKDDYVKTIAKSCKNIIIDNAQSFYSKPITGVDSFYSPRKFFGVADGAYLYTNNKLKFRIKEDLSYRRFKHLLIRIDKYAEYGYDTFIKNENNLAKLPIRQMSKLTRRILKSINYKSVAKKRLENYNFLNDALSKVNNIQFNSATNQIPVAYPLLTKKDNLRAQLINEKIYTPQYWPNVLIWTSKKSLENNYCSRMVFLPIDQRYNLKDMKLMLDTVNRLLQK